MSSSRVLGTGIDIVENRRMREILLRWGTRFKDRVFLPSEQKYCESRAVPYRHYAGRFAVKEAVTKAFGTGITPSIGWLDIEVEKVPATGAPVVRLRGRGREMACARHATEVLISLSYTRTHAVAHALLVGEEAAA